MNTKFYITKIQISARKTMDGINCGFDINSTRTSVEKLSGLKVVAIREATSEEVEIIKSGMNVSF